MLARFWDHLRYDWPIWGISAVIVAVIGLIFYAAVQENREWEAFAAAHECRVIGHMTGSSTSSIGVSSNGQTVVTPVYIPGKIGYACNDGLQYWRDE